MSSLNKKYLEYLTTHPLLTKSLTGAAFAALNEAIATILAKEFAISPITFTIFQNEKTIKLLNPYNYKIPLLALFALVFQGPFSHYAYKLLNGLAIFKQRPLPLFKKLLQMLVSLMTITPIVCCVNAIFLGIINNEDLMMNLLSQGDTFGFIQQIYKTPKSTELQAKFLRKLKEIYEAGKAGLFNNGLTFLKSSWVSSPLIMFFAQSYLDPNSWVVFFNLAYFILGTFQNTLLKLRLRKIREAKKVKEENNETKQD